MEHRHDPGHDTRHDPQHYDGLAEHFEHLTAHGPDPVAEWLPNVLPQRGGTAIDVGCGAGRHTLQLAERFDRVVAVDLSQEMIELARAKRPAANVAYTAADMFDVDGTYDFVFSSAMLHHVPDLDAALVHLRGLVAPGGTAALTDVTAPSNRAYRLALRIAPRGVYRLGAAVGLAARLLTRQPDAWTRFRAETCRPWLDHLATDRFLTRAAFDRAYAAVFPGATFTDVNFMRACLWRNA